MRHLVRIYIQSYIAHIDCEQILPSMWMVLELMIYSALPFFSFCYPLALGMSIVNDFGKIERTCHLPFQGQKRRVLTKKTL